MKKTVVIFITIVIVAIASIMMYVSQYNEQQTKIKTFNLEYENFKDETIYGTELASLINNAINNNEKHEIEKDNNEKYIDDDKLCIRIEVIMKSIENGEPVTYDMENINALGMERFVGNFNLVEFECEEILYNSLGRVSKLVFKLKE